MISGHGLQRLIPLLPLDSVGSVPGNFKDYIWDSDSMKRTMPGQGDCWSLSNNVDSVNDTDKEEQGQPDGTAEGSAIAAKPP